MDGLLETSFRCAACGEENETLVDPSQGSRPQTYVEDCRVCCRPNVLTVTVSGEDVHVAAELEA